MKWTHRDFVEYAVLITVCVLLFSNVVWLNALVLLSAGGVGACLRRNQEYRNRPRAEVIDLNQRRHKR